MNHDATLITYDVKNSKFREWI